MAHHIEAEDDHEDDQSDYGSTFSDTTSLSPSIKAYQYENGRRYHAYKEGSYWGPNDEQQNDQLDLFHHIFNLLLNGELTTAPLGDKPQRILDVGTGTGIWVIDMADKYPSAEVIGTDLSPTQPTWVPPNSKFEIEDFLQPWTFAKDSFDLVHMRMLFGSVDDWPKLMGEAFKATKPGGWIESIEAKVPYQSDDNTLPADSKLIQWSLTGMEASEKIGKSFDIATKTKGWIQDAGFVNVKETILPVPVGVWPRDKRMKEIGQANLINMLEGLEGFSMAVYTRILGWSAEDVNDLLGQVRADMKNRKYHSYLNMHFVIGQKPEVPAAV